jgi:hypothetical protein
MDWSQVLTILGGNIALFLWAVRQSRADFLHLDRKLDENRKETNLIVKSIQEEVVDFHSRIIQMEERRGKIK